MDQQKKMEELLIALVRDRPCLYNLRHENYKKENIKQNNWREIAKELGLDENDVKKRWRSLRDTYVRKRAKAKDQSRSGGTPTPDPAWIWWEAMKWLDPYLIRNSTLSSLDSFRKESVVGIEREEDVVGLGREETVVGREREEEYLTEEDIESVSQTGSLSTASAATPTPAKRRKMKSSDNFEAEFFKRWDKTEDLDDECTRFGKDVADQVRAITDERYRLFVMNEIRGQLYKFRFGNFVPSFIPQPAMTLAQPNPPYPSSFSQPPLQTAVQAHSSAATLPPTTFFSPPLVLQPPVTTPPRSAPGHTVPQ